MEPTQVSRPFSPIPPRRLRAACRIVLGAALVAIVAAGWTAQEPPPRVIVLRIDDRVINPVVLQYVLDGIERAEREGAACVVVELDTPGGLLESTRGIVKAFMASRVPIVVYVTPSGARAASAGVFITMAAHVAAMAPSTTIGAAHPVTIGEGDGIRRIVERGAGDGGTTRTLTPGASPMEEKILNDTVAWAEGIAKTRGRNADWARRAVVESVSIGEQQALEQGVIDVVASDLSELLRKIDGRDVRIGEETRTLRTAGAAVQPRPMSALERFLMVLTHPEIAYLLMMLGTLGLIFEFTHPGVGFPGIAGVICLLLGLYALQMMPVNYLALALLGLGVVLLVAEAFVASHGLLALGGLTCLTLGSIFLIESPDETMRVSLWTVGATVGTTGAIVLVLIQRAVRSYRTRVATGREAMIGARGTALSELAPEGQVFVHGERWRAVAVRPPIPEGRTVRVVGMEGLVLRVDLEQT